MNIGWASSHRLSMLMAIMPTIITRWTRSAGLAVAAVDADGLALGDVDAVDVAEDDERDLQVPDALG
jgi:hypothetical protein